MKGTRMMALKKCFPFGLLLAGIVLLPVRINAASYYYFQGFTSQAAAESAGWTNFGNAANAAASAPFHIGRDGIFLTADNTPLYGRNEPSFIDVSGQRLRIAGRANNGEIFYNNIWSGKAVRFFPSRSGAFGGANFVATAEDPIGFQVIRHLAHVDSSDEVQADNPYHKSAINIWLAQHDPLVVNEWQNLANFVYFFEKADMDANGAAGPWPADASMLGVFDGSENIPTSATGPTNEAYTRFTSTDWRKLYDENVDVTINSFGYGTAPNANLQPLGIRITHDGSTVRFYLNPNPVASDGYLDGQPNQFYLFHESPVSWNDNMIVMFGHESLYYLTEEQAALYDDFLVRSVCNTLVATNWPQNVLAGSKNIFRMQLTPSFNATDAGIGEIVIRKPAFVTNDWDLSRVWVTNDFDQNGNLAGLTKTDGTTLPNQDQFLALVDHNGDLKIVFRTTDTGSGIIRSTTLEKRIQVAFELGMPAVANAGGADFQVFAGQEKYDTWTRTLTNLPTTGPKRATPVSTGAMTVRSYQQPFAYAGITATPSVINEGVPSTVNADIVYELSTKDVVNRPDISQAIIQITNGFQISNVNSLLINNDSVNIEVTNNSYYQFIVLNYAAETGGRLPSPNGYDRITFRVYGTPDIPDDLTNQQFKFASTVSSYTFVSGTTHQLTGTNTNYPSQHLTVASADPVVQCHVFPKRLANAIKTNDVVYTVRNNGDQYNRVYRIRINLDPLYVANILDPWSSRGATVTYHGDHLMVNYGVSPLTSGIEDSISFKLVHSIADINNPDTTINLTSESDNRNGKGFLLNTQSALLWSLAFVPPAPKGEAYVAPEEIWTSDLVSTFTVSIYNDGPKGDRIQQARIEIPSIFTNFLTTGTVTSAILGTSQMVRTNIAGKNYLWLRYHLAGTNIVSKNEDIGLIPKDVVTLTLADNVVNVTNRLSFQVHVDNKTNAAFVSTAGVSNKAADFAPFTQFVNLAYPPVFAAFDVQSRFTNSYVLPPEEQFGRIDATTATNLIVVRVQNTGDYGNFVRQVRIELPESVGTNIVPDSITSSLLSTGGVEFNPRAGVIPAHVLVNYQAGIPPTNLSAGLTDTIRFRMIDFVDDNRMASFVLRLSNDRELARVTNYLPGPGYGFGNLEVFIPPAQAAGAVSPKVFFTTPHGAVTNTVVYTITNRGGGSNRLTEASILFPALFTGQVVSASNSFLNLTQASPHMSLNPTNLVINYAAAGTMLDPGKTDTVTLRVRVNYNSFPLQNVTWELGVRNAGAVTNYLTTTVSGRSKMQYATVQPYFTVYETGINDHEVFTSNTTNDINLRFYNGTNGGGQAVQRVRVTVPADFNLPQVHAASGYDGTAAISRTGRQLTFAYGTPLAPQNLDTLQLRLTDDVEEEERLTVWAMEADYGDGFWLPAGSNGLIDSTMYTNVLAIVLPPATARAWLDPDYLYVPSASQVYTVTVLNNGIPGNHIRLIEITPPAELQITNITGIANSGPAAVGWYESGKLYLRYTGTRLLVGASDAISFTGWDSVDTAPGTDAYPWTVRVANVTNLASLSTATVPNDKTLSTVLTYPSYRAEYHVTPNTVDTTTLTNLFTFHVDNKSPQTASEDSYIDSLKIELPSVFLTNNLLVTTKRPAAVTISNLTVRISYAQPMPPKSNDMITLRVRDTVAEGETNVRWNLLVNFNTLGGVYTNANLTSGTNDVWFRMPRPDVQAWFSQREVFRTSTNASLALQLSNRGTGSNQVYRIRLPIPTPFLGRVSDPQAVRAAAVALVGNDIVLDYTNLTAGRGDTLSFRLANNITTPSNILFSGIATNSTWSSNLHALSLGNQLRIVNAPRAALDPQVIDTTSSLNVVRLHVNNNGGGNSAIERLRFTVPAIFDTVAAVQSSRVAGASITNSGSTYFIEYGANRIQPGQAETVTLTLGDSFTHGSSNVSWQPAADNGTGFAPLVAESGGALTSRFRMPTVAAQGWMVKEWIYAADNDATSTTNTITLALRNTGAGSNNVYRFLLKIPTSLTNIGDFVSSHGGVFLRPDAETLVIDYSGLLLAPGQQDLVSFRLVNNVSAELSFLYGFHAVNSNVAGDIPANYTMLAAPEGFGQRLDTFIKEEAPEVFIANARAPYLPDEIVSREIYTMDDQADIFLSVRNRSKRHSIQRLLLPLTNIYTVQAVESTRAGLLNAGSYTHQTNMLAIDYGSLPVGQQQTDTVRIRVGYNNTALALQVASQGSITNLTEGLVGYAGSPDWSAARHDGRHELVLANARFGRFRGLILPRASGATVTLKYQGNDTLATNIDGRTFNASVNTNNGFFVVDRIPPVHPYTMIVLPPTLEGRTNDNRIISPVSFQTAQRSNQVAIANRVLTLEDLTLVYGKLNYQALGYQEVVCPEDPETKLIVPPGTLFEGFTVNISIVDMTDPQETNAAANPLVGTPADTTVLTAFEFRMADREDRVVNENGFKADVELVFHYQAAAIAGQGWDVNRLAIFYWKATTREWIPVGGTVDPATGTIRARVGYLHGCYAVMQLGRDSNKAIRNVVASPNPFTPGRGSAESSRLKLSFSFNQPYASYEVKIFNMRGQMVYQRRHDGSYAQGEVFWDGSNLEGFRVPGGVYVYQVIAGDNVFSGSVLVLR